jgi:hypothetical protein
VETKLSGLHSVGESMITECGAVGEMRNGRGNRSAQSRPASVPRCDSSLMDVSMQQAGPEQNST